MLLRSSSTPILGSLLPSHSESPKHNNRHTTDLLNSPKHRPTRLSANQTGPLNAIPPSSPSPKSSPCRKTRARELRRVYSAGNLDEMVTSRFDEFYLRTLHRDKEVERDRIMKVESRQRSMQAGSDEKLGRGRNILVEKDGGNIPSKMHLAKGLGAVTGGYIGGGGVGGGLEECQRLGLGGNGNDEASVEEYYKRMVEQNPGDALYLSNYAQFLYQTKKDLKGAEEYYSRAILADPSDGDILSVYAKLTWELHHDEERASGYFERAVQAAPEDSHVLAAYAGFLWETEEEEEAENAYLQPAVNNVIAVRAY